MPFNREIFGRGAFFAALILSIVFLAPSATRSQMEDLYMPRVDTMHSVTGWDSRYSGVPGWVPDNVWQQTFTRKYVKLAPGENYVLADMGGPGVITRFYFTLPPKLPKNNLRALVIRIYWDGEENPSVLSPMGDFFGAPFGEYVRYDSQPQSMMGGGFVSRFFMPFKKSARIEIENGSTTNEASFVFFGINWYKTPQLPDNILYFHALWRRTNPTVQGEPHVVADIKGSGNYVGVRLFFQNRSRFIFRGLYTLMLPMGFGMGNLEGWEEIFVDGVLVQHGTGTEEYFNSGAYFLWTPYHGIYEGVLMRSYTTGRVSAYRFHILDPIPFKSSFKIIWHHGLLDSIPSDYASTAYWYQSEPHVPQTIPDLAGRMPSSTAGHTAQAILMFPLVYGIKAFNHGNFR